MADNVTIPATGTGTATPVIASDDIGGVQYQRVKLSLGADGTAADAPVGAGTEAGVLRVTLPTDGTGRVTSVGGSARGAGLSGNPLVEGGRASATVPGTAGQDGTVDGWNTLNGARVVFSITPTATLSNVAGSASSVTLQAANAARRGLTIWNDSTSVLYVKFGTTASATSCTVKLIADAYYEVPYGYTDIVTGIWVSATGSARMTELT